MPIVIVDSIEHGNIIKYYYTVPSLIAKIFLLSQYYSISGSSLTYLYSFNNNNNIQEIKKDILTKQEKFEVDLQENNLNKLELLDFYMNKHKFNSEDTLNLFLKSNDKMINYILNTAVCLTVLSPFI